MSTTRAPEIAQPNAMPAPGIEQQPPFRWTSAVDWLASVPILYKVLIANAAIVVFGAVAGTWMTIQLARDSHAASGAQLILLFAFVGVLVSVAANFLVLRAAFRPLTNLERVANAVRDGDVTVRVARARYTDPQLARLSDTFNDTLDELAKDREQLRALASQVIRAQEDERKRIARELHDDTAQVLFAQLLRLTAMKSSPNDDMRITAGELEDMTVEAIEGVRRLALELRPPSLDDLGLRESLGDLAERFSRQLDIPVEYQPRVGRDRLPAEIELVLYRVAQEAMTNIAKHAGAAHASINLTRRGELVTLIVTDNGRGFDPALASKQDDRGLGLGLFGMEERVVLVGGILQIISRSGIGTAVIATIPLDSRMAASFGGRET
jgi:two-component system sensor histidine kinase UhpB